jgi:hypothetical protein
MDSINLNVSTVEVKASVRPLKSKWTREMATDLEHHTDLDLSSFEIYFARQIRKEKRKESIKKIFNN